MAAVLQFDSKAIVAGSEGMLRLNNFPPGIGAATLSLSTYAGLSIEGTVGGRYQIEYSTDLNPDSWATLTTIVLPKSPYLFFDVESPRDERRFYRALAKP